MCSLSLPGNTCFQFPSPISFMVSSLSSRLAHLPPITFPPCQCSPKSVFPIFSFHSAHSCNLVLFQVALCQPVTPPSTHPLLKPETWGYLQNFHLIRPIIKKAFTGFPTTEDLSKAQTGAYHSLLMFKSHSSNFECHSSSPFSPLRSYTTYKLIVDN